MLLSASIDSGIGLTAGKKLVGKTIPQSDDTYLTTVNLKNKFSQLKNFLTIKEQPKIETENIEQLKKAISKLQDDLNIQTTITKTISEENQKIKKTIKEMDEGLSNRIMEMMKVVLTTAKIEDPIAYQKTVKAMLKERTLATEENTSKNKDKTG